MGYAVQGGAQVLVPPCNQRLTRSVGQLDVQGRLGKVAQLPHSSIGVCRVDEVVEALHRPQITAGCSVPGCSQLHAVYHLKVEGVLQLHHFPLCWCSRCLCNSLVTFLAHQKQ